MMDKIRINPFFFKQELNKHIKNFLQDNSYLKISENKRYFSDKNHRFAKKDGIHL